MAVSTACALSLALGLVFLFLWSPLPWGWEGIDRYHDRAIRLASGLPFDTTDVPWGYAYFLAAFYAVFGPRPWVPLVAQVALNALVPLLLFRLAQPLAGRRVAALAALLVGVFSFNTVYTSTQSSDSISTVVFLAGVLLLARGIDRKSSALFAAAGLAAGIAPQFRPNLILFPLFAASLYVLVRRFSGAALLHAAVYLCVATLTLVPWTARNYRLTGTLVPTSTHGGIQLWYGTLQTGPHIESRSHNPRSAFESAAFDYTSIPGPPLTVTAEYGECREGASGPAIEYWTDRHPAHQRVRPIRREGRQVVFELPGQSDPTTLYYFIEDRYAPDGDLAQVVTNPPDGAVTPYVTFVATDHLGDLDRHDDLLDIFDVVRLVQHLAWQSALPRPELVDLDGNGRIDETDLAAAVTALVPELGKSGPPAIVLRHSDTEATVDLSWDSHLTVPREFGGRQTDVQPAGQAAFSLVSRWRSYADLGHSPRRPRPGECGLVERVAVNGVFYRREVHMMNRYLALAFDNIGRDPWAFVRASVYRMLRLFVIRGTDDPATTQQFARSRLVYGAGFALSVAYLALFAVGAAIALSRRSPAVWLLVPVAYVPLTIGVMLTNMRYTMTVQPLVFVFVAMAVAWAFGLEEEAGRRRT